MERHPQHSPCTPLPAGRLYGISVLDGDGGPRWRTVGWGFDQARADSIAAAYVAGRAASCRAARVRHDGRVTREHHRPAY